MISCEFNRHLLDGLGRTVVGWLGQAVVVCLFSAGMLQADDRLTLNFNPDWKFIKADPAGAEQPGFDDQDWIRVSTPHTFNDTDTFDNWSLPGHRGEQNQWGGRTWYRKSFLVPEAYRGKRIYIEFEAVRQIAEVYLNGHLLGISRSGFIPFGFDLTPQVRFGATNVLAVMCDNRFMKDPLPSEGAEDHPSLSKLSAKVNGTIPDNVEDIRADQIPWNNPHWHPAHGGIYRNVRLYVTDPLHISLPLYSHLRTVGPYVYAAQITSDSARVTMVVPVQNERAGAEEIEVQAEVFDTGNQPVMTVRHTEHMAAGAQGAFDLTGVIDHPKLWAPDYPYLYRVVCSLKVGGELVDSCEVPLGIRTVRWDVAGGFYINGRHVKLHGWGQKPTDEWPGLGAAQPDWMHFYTLDLMKEAGGNFVRWGHCAGGPASITSGDRLGIIAEQPGVDGESDTRGAAWTIRAEAFRDMIIYYRNHPSILIWEGGNQKVSREHAAQLRGYMDQYDPHGGRAYAHRRADKTTAEFMDIGIGTEGGREIATLPVVEGEYDREESPRRVWDDYSPPNFGYPVGEGQTYHLNSEQYAVNQVAQYVRKLGAPDHCGGANWIFSDSTSGGRLASEVTRASGEVDGARLPKEAYYVCQTMFRSDPQIHIIGHWTYPAGTRKTVFVVANGDSVGLWVNGKSLGRKTATNRYLFTFPEVNWAPGEIKAVAYTDGRGIAEQTKHTVGPPVRLRLTPLLGPSGLQANGADVVLIDVEAVDADGERCPTIQSRVDFQTDGPGVWRGGYNSGKAHSINLSHLDLEAGINRVAIRSTRTAGEIHIRAAAPGLVPGSLAVRSVPVEVENGASRQLPPMPQVRLPDAPPSAASPAGLVLCDPEAETESEPTTGGRFTTGFSYSGPTVIVHLERNARAGKNAYVDRDCPFEPLPEQLSGADWVQAALTDRNYDAEDLMEIAVKAGAVVTVAHDAALPVPDWLAKRFQDAGESISINGRAMRLFERRCERDESLTLGANAEGQKADRCNMYVVFVNALATSTARAHPQGG